MSTIDPAKAVNVVELLESAIRSADPQFSSPRPASIKAALCALVATGEHKAKALAVGQNIDALLMLAQRQIFEITTTIRNISLTMPAADINGAAIRSIIETLNAP